MFSTFGALRIGGMPDARVFSLNESVGGMPDARLFSLNESVQLPQIVSAFEVYSSSVECGVQAPLRLSPQ